MKIPTPQKENGDCNDTSDDDKSNSGPDDFSEYMWMENEEEFDNEVMKQLEEEALMEQCIEAMLEDELESKNSLFSDSFLKEFEKMGMQEKAELAKNSKLNPDAAEFVPRAPVTGSS